MRYNFIFAGDVIRVVVIRSFDQIRFQNLSRRYDIVSHLVFLDLSVPNESAMWR